ncbi:MAG TPA: glycosyltransferase [Terriglobales bacterium]|nr:glycosyltransferase [Terriglobales bacterium]
MKILITNAHLENPAGTEVVVRDLAGEFLRRGHTPLVYSPKLGAVAEEIRNRGIEITDRLESLSAVPDVIHGHHHPQVVEALLHFPATPALFVCHGSLAAVEEPFAFPRILRYVAVDERCRARSARALGVPEERILMIGNAVDLARFPARGPLPPRPQRALVFGSQASPPIHLAAVRRACRHFGLRPDLLGYVYHARPDPESVLPAYDLVFAKGRCALEAMAVGAAVVLCDFAGAGPMVTSSNFDRLRAVNFGEAALTNPLRARALRPELARYDPADAAAVSRRVRHEASLQAAGETWLALYAQIIEESSRRQPDPQAELRALAAYLQQWSYGKRVEWERQQLQRLGLAGRGLARLLRRFAHQWSGGY